MVHNMWRREVGLLPELVAGVTARIHEVSAALNVWRIAVTADSRRNLVDAIPTPSTAQSPSDSWPRGHSSTTPGGFTAPPPHRAAPN
jgi:hypothetical protein